MAHESTFVRNGIVVNVIGELDPHTVREIAEDLVAWTDKDHRSRPRDD